MQTFYENGRSLKNTYGKIRDSVGVTICLNGSIFKD